MWIKRFLCVSVVILWTVSPAFSKEEHHETEGKTKQLGSVQFPISCSAEAQKRFNHAVALLHSFWYEKAGQEFNAITEMEPTCAMGYWGVAMSLYHPLWAPPSVAELQKGREAVKQAKSAGTKTGREKDYIYAIEVFYKDSDKLDHRTRALAYEKAMERVYRRYPDDPEAAIFYALALNGTAQPTDKNYTNQKKAAEILNRMLGEKPDHPGVAHYIIHSYDSPALAQLALPAARSYAKIAPASPHALHMPSHIFTRLGMWRESIESNQASATAAEERVLKIRPDTGSFEQLHALDYLMYAYLQIAQDQQARQMLDKVRSIEKVDTGNFAAAYAFAAIPARYALERRQWSEAAALTVYPDTFPWERFRYAEAITHFANALGAARSGDVAGAQKGIEKLDSIHQALLDAKDGYWADQVKIQREVAAAWLAHAQGKNEEALNLMQSAADLEDSTEKHPVTPGPLFPARELLGDLLLELNQPARALTAYETSLQSAPNRFNSFYGAANAAVRAGDREKAKIYFTRLAELSEQAEGDREGNQAARTLLLNK